MSRPFIPAENCVKIELIYTCSSLVAENVFYWHSDHPLTLSEMNDVANATRNAWNITIRGITCPNWSLTTIKITGMSTDHEPFLAYTIGLPIAGNVAATAAPPNVTFCISCRTGLAGRSNRGRWYVVGLANTQTPPSGLISSAYAEVLRAAVAAFHYEMTWGANPVQGIHAICSFRHDKAWRNTADVHEVTNYIVTDLNVDSQRRRLPGRGRT